MPGSYSAKLRHGSVTTAYAAGRHPRGDAANGTLLQAYLMQYGEGERVAGTSRSEGPEWRSSVAIRVSELMDFSDGWDGYGAPAVRFETGNFAVHLLTSFASAETPSPSVVPSSVGGIQFEWHTPEYDFEIHVAAPYEIEFLYEDHRTGERRCDELADDMSALADPFARISDIQSSASRG